MTDTFRWLHLTDLHWGSDGHRFDWGNVIDDLCEDLDRLQNPKHLDGPFDAVFFTGDLVYKGEADDYTKVSAILESLISRTSPKGRKPFFLAVPGNHDLVRPEDDDGALHLQHYFENKNIHKKIWKDKEFSGFKTIDGAFKNYTDWWETLSPERFRKPDTWQGGYMPGDFSASLSCGDLSIGVLGLNTAFLQLAGGDFEGKLALEKEQLVHACGEDYDKWEKRHHFNILMTHHPPNWLHPNSRDLYEGYLYKPSRFAFHLCGHVHSNELEMFTVSGTETLKRRLFTTISLFGHKFHGEQGSESMPQAERPLGYSAGMVQVLNGGKGEVRAWPRRYVKKRGSVYQLERDPSLVLDRDDDGTEVLPITVFTPTKNQPKTKPHETGKGMAFEVKKEPPSAGRTENQTLVRQGLLGLFSDANFELFCAEVKRIALKNHGKKDQLWVDLLLEMKTFQSRILVWEKATNRFLKRQANPKQAEIIAFEKGIGWLSLLAIDEAWKPKRPKASPELVRIKIPCSIQCCIEVVYSYAQKSYAQLVLLRPLKNLSQEEAETLKQDPLRSKAAIAVPKILDMGTEQEAHLHLLKREIFNRTEIDPDYFLNDFDSVQENDTNLPPTNDAKLNAKLRRRLGPGSAEKIYLLYEPSDDRSAKLRSEIVDRLSKDIEIPVVEPGEQEAIWVDDLTEEDLAATLEDYFKVLKKYSPMR